MTTTLKKIQFQAKVISDFRITIPSIERSLLNLQEGDFLIVEIQKTSQDSESLNKIMELFYQGFFEEFLEDLKENDPALFLKYVESREIKQKEQGEVSP